MTQIADIGIIGLGVMGHNLALNLADHGYAVACYDRNPQAVASLVSTEAKRKKLVGCATLRELLAALKRPWVIILLVPAGAPVDAVCAALIAEGIAQDDIVVDCGNSHFADTGRRDQEYRGKLTFFGSGISGGAEGARRGPSLMPGGDQAAWTRLKPIWESIAARVDARTGREIATASGVASGEPCAAYIGPGGAGHYVKMVHNGIEYADMQLIAEAYQLLRDVGGLSAPQIAEVFREWNAGALESYLLEISATLLDRVDARTGEPMVDVILDAAEQKGTGAWSAVNAMEIGVPTPTIAEAVFARTMSALKEERVRVPRVYLSSDQGERARIDLSIAAIGDALYCSKVCAYAQGFAQMSGASHRYGWNLDLREIARIWRGGCIIRARLLHAIADAYASNRALANLLVDSLFAEEIAKRHRGWRDVVGMAARAQVPVPCLASALAYFDSYRSARLPANLIQAQRDYFGGHGFERIDEPRGTVHHLD